jgi:hypothetical protein
MMSNDTNHISSLSIPIIEPSDLFAFNEQVGSIRLTVEWKSKGNIIVDLDLHVYIFDERVSEIK